MKEFIDSLAAKDNYELTDILYECASKGDLEKVKILFAQPQIQDNINFIGTNGVLVSACFSGNIELVKYLLTSHETKNHFDINDDYDSVLSSACEAGHLHIVKYLFESPELEKHPQIPFVNTANNNPVVLSVQSKNLELFEYLISVSKDKDDRFLNHVSKAAGAASSSNDFDFFKSFIELGTKYSNTVISAMLEGVIYSCCYSNNIEQIKYIFNSPNLAKHVDIHNDRDEIFRTLIIQARKDKPLDMLQYFIFDLNIDETEAIKEFRLTYKREVVENMFKLRDLNHNLHQDLSINELNAKKIKI
jgi:hypothetical protein